MTKTKDVIDLCRYLAAQGLLYFYNFRSAKSENEREETEAQPEMRRGGGEGIRGMRQVDRRWGVNNISLQ